MNAQGVFQNILSEVGTQGNVTRNHGRAATKGDMPLGLAFQDLLQRNLTRTSLSFGASASLNFLNNPAKIECNSDSNRYEAISRTDRSTWYASGRSYDELRVKNNSPVKDADSVKEEARHARIDEVDEQADDKRKDAGKKETYRAVEYLAFYLGMEPGQLLDALESLGLSADDFAEGSISMFRIQEKLQAAGWSQEDIQALVKLLQQVSQIKEMPIVEDAGAEPVWQNAEEKVSFVAGRSQTEGIFSGAVRANDGPEVVYNQAKTDVLDPQTLAELRRQFQNAFLGNRVNQDSEAASGMEEAEISANLSLGLLASEGDSASAVKTAREGISGDQEAVQTQLSIESADSLQSSDLGDSANEALSFAFAGRSNPEEIITDKTSGSGTEATAFQSIFQQVGAAGSKAGNVGSLTGKASVRDNEIFEQIIQKAKLSFYDGKSEMTLELKPENLGKLSLRLVHDRGMIIGKLTTENDQVRQVLESNLQTLKDALEKQGIAVQEFEVSVDHESAQRQALQQEEWSGSNKADAGRITGVYQQSSDLAAEKSDIGLYSGILWPDSSINITV